MKKYQMLYFFIFLFAFMSCKNNIGFFCDTDYKGRCIDFKDNNTCSYTYPNSGTFPTTVDGNFTLEKNKLIIKNIKVREKNKGKLRVETNQKNSSELKFTSNIYTLDDSTPSLATYVNFKNQHGLDTTLFRIGDRVIEFETKESNLPLTITFSKENHKPIVEEIKEKFDYKFKVDLEYDSNHMINGKKEFKFLIKKRNRREMIMAGVNDFNDLENLEYRVYKKQNPKDKSISSDNKF